MNIGRSSNPVLSNKVFSSQSYATDYSDTMTLNGTINKSIAMLLLVVVGALYTWKMFFGAATAEGGVALVMPWMIGGGIGDL